MNPIIFDSITLLTIVFFFMLVLSLSLSLSLSHTHTHTHILSIFLSLSLSLTHTFCLSVSVSLSHSHHGLVSASLSFLFTPWMDYSNEQHTEYISLFFGWQYDLSARKIYWVSGIFFCFLADNFLTLLSMFFILFFKN